MTHDAWERGNRLTIRNATKEQLKWMVKDKEASIASLRSEKQELKSCIDVLARDCGIAVALLREAGLYEKYRDMLREEKNVTIP